MSITQRPGPARPAARLALPVGAGVAVALAIYVIGTRLSPDHAISWFGRQAPNTNSLKSWIATAVLAGALLQLALALWIYGRLPSTRPAPAPVGRVHRLVGVLVILASLPVAYHCMRAYGVQTLTTRIAVHSLAGCFLYGAIVGKLIVVRRPGLPGWALPVAGGLLVVSVAVLWYASALWYFNGFRLPLLGS